MRKVLKAIILPCVMSYVVSCGRQSRGVVDVHTPIDVKTDLIIFDKNWDFVDYIKDEHLISTVIRYDDNSYGKVGVFSKKGFQGDITQSAYATCLKYLRKDSNADLYVYKEIVK